MHLGLGINLKKKVDGGACPTGAASLGYMDKIPPEKNPPEKIPLNAVECEPVPTRVLNPNASEASYKQKQRR